MMNDILAGLLWLSIPAMVIVMVLAMLDGNKNVNTKYYNLAHECVAAGGSWVPTTSYDAVCLQPRVTP